MRIELTIESLFQLKVGLQCPSAGTRYSFQFTAKSLQRQAKKANKDEAAEKNKLKLVRLSIRLYLIIGTAKREPGRSQDLCSKRYSKEE